MEKYNVKAVSLLWSVSLTLSGAFKRGLCNVTGPRVDGKEGGGVWLPGAPEKTDRHTHPHTHTHTHSTMIIEVDWVVSSLQTEIKPLAKDAVCCSKGRGWSND